MDKFMLELKENMIEILDLQDFSPEDFEDDQPLFGDNGLGLDSIDALELIVMLEKEYNIKIDNPEEGKSILTSVNSIAEYIKENNNIAA